MPNMPKQPGDAVLSRDGTVKLNGKKVGFWWVDSNDLYHFGFTRPENVNDERGAIASIFRHELKALIPTCLE